MRPVARAEPRPGGVLRFAAAVVPAGRTALWCSASGPGRRTRFAPCGRCAQTCCDKSVHGRASRSAPKPALLAAAEALRPPPGRGSSRTTVVFAAPWAGSRWRDFCGDEERRPQGRARSALRELTWSRLVERSERSDRSEFRDRPCGRAPQWSLSAAKAAAAERRRLPAQGAARSSPSKRRTTAMRRQPPSNPQSSRLSP